MKNVRNDIGLLHTALEPIPTFWDGKEAIMTMKQHDYQWKQMEWIGFYFELLCQDRLKDVGFSVPGRRYGKVEFDAHRSINWDLKTSAIKSHGHRIILNDTQAVEASIEEFGCHGIVLCLVDVDYNDNDRTFQEWHTELKGGLSAYERDRRARNATSRYRKTSAQVAQILLLALNKDNIPMLNIHRQGRNSNGNLRQPKYELNIECAHQFEVDRIEFS